MPSGGARLRARRWRLRPGVCGRRPPASAPGRRAGRPRQALRAGPLPRGAGAAAPAYQAAAIGQRQVGIWQAAEQVAMQPGQRIGAVQPAGGGLAVGGQQLRQGRLAAHFGASVGHGQLLLARQVGVGGQVLLQCTLDVAGAGVHRPRCGWCIGSSCCAAPCAVPAAPPGPTRRPTHWPHAPGHQPVRAAGRWRCQTASAARTGAARRIA